MCYTVQTFCCRQQTAGSTNCATRCLVFDNIVCIGGFPREIPPIFPLIMRKYVKNRIFSRKRCEKSKKNDVLSSAIINGKTRFQKEKTRFLKVHKNAHFVHIEKSEKKHVFSLLRFFHRFPLVFSHFYPLWGGQNRGTNCAHFVHPPRNLQNPVESEQKTVPPVVTQCISA